MVRWRGLIGATNFAFMAIFVTEICNVHVAIASHPETGATRERGAMEQALHQKGLQMEALVKNNPRDYCALYQLGKYKENSGDLRGAMADLNSSLQCNPLKTDSYTSRTHPTERTLRAWAFQDLGYIYCIQKQYQKGVDCLSHAIALRPNYCDNFQNRAAAYQALHQSALARQDMARANYLRQADLPDECLTAPPVSYASR